MSCPACKSQPSGQVFGDCRTCAIRELARGPLFWQCKQEQKLSDAYKAELRKLGEVPTVHVEVKAFYENLMKFES